MCSISRSELTQCLHCHLFTVSTGVSMWTQSFIRWLHNKMYVFLQLSKGKENKTTYFIESCALSVLFLCVWYLLRWESKLMERLLAVTTILRKCSKRTIVQGTWPPFNHGRRQGDEKSRSLQRGFVLRWLWRWWWRTGSKVMIMTESVNGILKRQFALAGA